MDEDEATREVFSILSLGPAVRRHHLLRARQIAKDNNLPDEVMAWLAEGLYQIIGPVDAYQGDITYEMLHEEE